MNERDIRTAFQHLKEDVMTNVQTEERLEKATKRPTWVRPAVTVFAGAAAVFIVVGAAVLAFRPSDPDPAPPATTVTSTTVTETTEEPTIVPGITAGTVLLAEFGATPAESDEVVLVDGWTVTSDGSGGLLIDRSDTITRVAADGTEMVLLNTADLSADDGSAALRLEDVAFVDGAAQAIVVVTYRQDTPDDGREFPEIFQEIWQVDVETGATSSVWSINAFESNITRVSVASDRMLVSVAFEGGTYFEYLDTAGQPIDVVGPFYDEPIGVASVPTVIDQGVLSPEGSMFVYLEIDSSTYLEGPIPVAIVSWDLDAGVETGRLELELRNGARPGRMDFDGSGVVLERYLDRTAGIEQLEPLRIESLANGQVTELDTSGRPSLAE
ncbi:MAG: hypothetical protein HKN01_02050 [Acidimicrobiia bacterium]|nr:hypothetical protein [Acidimicrobiia bacterium]MBT8198778.1 hypothetical protein [Acidimicrobiia bacterium]NNF68528.1 hypothetical protein [Acidimicrobiia bacterium]